MLVSCIWWVTISQFFSFPYDKQLQGVFANGPEKRRREFGWKTGMARKRRQQDKKTVVGAGKYLRLVSEETWEYVERPQSSGVVVIVAVTDDERIVLIEQYRQAVHSTVIELPAGLAGDNQDDPDEDPVIAAQRELIEETGYEAADMRYLARGPSSPGLTSEMINFYHARGLKKVGSGGGVENEQIVVHEVPLAEIDRWLAERADAGTVIDQKVYAGLYLAAR